MDQKIFNEATEWVNRRFPGIAKNQTIESAADQLGACYLVSPDFCREADVEASRTDKYMWHGLRLAAIKCSREGRPLDAELANWVADVLEDQDQPSKLAKDKKRPRPRGGARHEGRDRLICNAIVAVVSRFEPRPTRSTRRETASNKCCAAGGSACDVVGAAAFPGESLSYGRTAKIWERRPDGLRDLFQLGAWTVRESFPSLHEPFPDEPVA